MLRSALVSAVVAAGLIAPAAASAVTVQKAGTDLLVIADPGESNELTVSHSGSLFTISDDDAPVGFTGGGCFVDGSAISCDDTGVVRIHVDAGDGLNEVWVTAPFEVTIDGTAGTRNGFDATGATSATLNGGPGDDTLVGSAGNDEINGGADDDTLNGGVGADELYGNGGEDTAIFPGIEPVLVTLDDLANDGHDGGAEGDNVHSSVENVTGGSGDDELRGSPLGNVLNGSGGHDTLLGGGGIDTLNGNAGNDTLDGGENADTLNGGSWGDVLRGGDGHDVLNGEDGGDDLSGGQGSDVLNGDSGNDTANYSDRTAGVTVDLDGGGSDDGETGEGDSVGDDVEEIEGGSGNDVLTGSSDNEKIIGNAGDDTIDAGGGADLVIGNAGADTLTATDGMNDYVNCGGDLGTLQADPGDDVEDCPVAPAAGGGTTDAPVGPAGAGGPGPGFGPAPQPPSTPVVRPVLAIGPAAVRLSRKRDVRIKLTCSSANCTGTLRLTRKVKGKTVVVGRARYSVAAGKSRVVKVRVSKTTVRRIGRKGLRVTATAGTAKRTITVKRGR